MLPEWYDPQICHHLTPNAVCSSSHWPSAVHQCYTEAAISLTLLSMSAPSLQPLIDMSGTLKGARSFPLLREAEQLQSTQYSSPWVLHKGQQQGGWSWFIFWSNLNSKWTHSHPSLNSYLLNIQDQASSYCYYSSILYVNAVLIGWNVSHVLLLITLFVLF